MTTKASPGKGGTVGKKRQSWASSASEAVSGALADGCPLIRARLGRSAGRCQTRGIVESSAAVLVEECAGFGGGLCRAASSPADREQLRGLTNWEVELAGPLV